MKNIRESELPSMPNRQGRRLLIILACTLSVGMAGCGDSGVPIDSGPGDSSWDATPDRIIGGPCDPALALDQPTHISANSVHALRPTGGTGAYHFTFVDNASDARLQERSGDYLAGSATGVVDIIRVTDDGCEGSVEHSISILMPLEVRPSTAIIPLMSSLTFEISGGSGEYHFEMLLAGSMGSVDMESGAYMAGSTEGRDVIEVTDINTLESRQATLDVLEAGGIRLTAGQLSLALGSTGQAPVEGGSGYYDLRASAPDIVSFEEARILAMGPGVLTVTAEDHFTGDSVDIPVTVMAPAMDTLFRQGNAFEERRILATGDLNGDLFPDAVVGMPEADAGGDESGAVFVYAGNGSGFDPTPVQILHPGRRYHRFGSGVQVADLDDDGQLDLVVSAPLANIQDEIRAWYQIGGIYVYRGIVGGFFEEAPSDVMRGNWAYDQTGMQIAVCDFNGDGSLDIAAGATEAEERVDGIVTGAGTAGALAIYFGSAGGFGGSPNQMIYGATFRNTGAFEGTSQLRLGRQLAAGDFDGDGVCDLAAMAQSPHRDWGRNNDGAVFLYRGMRGTGTDAGGLSPLPYRALVGRLPNPAAPQTNASGWFGYELQVADLNADGRDDLVIGHPYWDDTERLPSAWNDRGAIYLILGRADGGTLGTEYELAHTSADAVLYGHEAGAHWGRGIGIGDLDGDGTLELAVGAPAAEQTPMPANSGEVYRVDLVDEEGALSLVASDWVGHDVNGSRFGQAVAITPNPDRSPGGDLLVLARFDWTDGDYVGGTFHAAYSLSEDPMVPAFEPPTRLEYPDEPAGASLGQAADVVGDVTQNGFPDLLVGVMRRGTRGMSNAGLYWGAAYLYEGRSDGFDLSGPVAEMQGDNGQHSYGYFGSQVGAAGDFNRDGHPDFAVVGQNTDRSGNARGVTRGPAARCGSNRGSNPGATFVYLSQPGADYGISEPAFVYYGPSNSFHASDIVGGFDFNGDSYDDLLLAAYYADVTGTDSGAVVLIPGRPADADPTTTEEICGDAAGATPTASAPVVIPGLYAYEYLGKGVAPLGDLNGDGCDEVALGGEQYGTPTGVDRRYGAVDIVFGWSIDPTSPCPREMRTLRLVSSVPGSRAGSAVSGGADIDGDGLSELLVTGRTANAGLGRAWIVRGSYIAGNIPTTALELGVLQEPGQEALEVGGTEPYVDYGWSAAFVPNLAGDDAFGIAIGVRYAGQVDDYVRRGGASVHRVIERGDGYAIEAQRYIVFPGEDSTYDPRFGERIRVGPYGDSASNRHAILIASPYSQAVGNGWGTVWVHPLGR